MVPQNKSSPHRRGFGLRPLLADSPSRGESFHKHMSIEKFIPCFWGTFSTAPEGGSDKSGFGQPPGGCPHRWTSVSTRTPFRWGVAPPSVGFAPPPARLRASHLSCRLPPPIQHVCPIKFGGAEPSPGKATITPCLSPTGRLRSTPGSARKKHRQADCSSGRTAR